MHFKEWNPIGRFATAAKEDFDEKKERMNEGKIVSL